MTAKKKDPEVEAEATDAAEDLPEEVNLEPGVGEQLVTFAVPFKWSPNGRDVIHYEPGHAVVPDRCAEVAAQAEVLAKG